MSATATMTVASPGTLTTAPTSTPCCPKCGFGTDLPPFEETQTTLLTAQKQIADLEAQVRLLNQKASAAVDRWADYEDELAKLRAQLESRPQTPSPSAAQQAIAKQTSLPTPPSSAAGPPTPSPSRASFLTTSAATRISALLSRKSPPPPPQQPQQLQLPPTLKPLPSAPRSRSAPGPQQPPQPSPIPSLPSSATYPYNHNPSDPHSPPPSLPTSSHLTTEDLLTALSHEQTLRRSAESQLNQTSREVEELSASLFEQANEMVATERRARAKLEERVGQLESREGDKKRRLERLERAVGRIERVRAVLREEEGG